MLNTIIYCLSKSFIFTTVYSNLIGYLFQYTQILSVVLVAKKIYYCEIPKSKHTDFGPFLHRNPNRIFRSARKHLRAFICSFYRLSVYFKTVPVFFDIAITQGLSERRGFEISRRDLPSNSIKYFVSTGSTNWVICEGNV